MILKPCPFCGNRPTYDQGTQDVWCPGHTDKLSVREWNARHIPDGYGLVSRGLLSDLAEILVIFGESDHPSITKAQAMITAAQEEMK